jgi:thymidylate synthase
MKFLVGVDHNDAYIEMVHAILRHGTRTTSRNGDVRSLAATTVVQDTRRPFITARGRVTNPSFSLAEVLWILTGSNEVEFLSLFNRRIGDYSDDGVHFNAAYGHRLRSAFGHDQLDDVIRTLLHHPDSRQAVLSVWDPRQDRGWRPDRGQEWRGAFYQVPNVTKDRACNVTAMMTVRGELLDWTQVMRSNDVTWGTPNNFVQWWAVQNRVACSVGTSPGEYVHVTQNLHAYDFNSNLDEVKYFDLYRSLGQDDHGDTNISDYAATMLVERARALFLPTVDAALLPPPEVVLSPFWRTAFELFRAYALNRYGRWEAAAAVLSAPDLDPVLAALQARHLYSHHWHDEDDTRSLGALQALHDAPWANGDQADDVWEWLIGDPQEK